MVDERVAKHTQCRADGLVAQLEGLLVEVEQQSQLRAVGPGGFRARRPRRGDRVRWGLDSRRGGGGGGPERARLRYLEVRTSMFVQVCCVLSVFDCDTFRGGCEALVRWLRLAAKLALVHAPT